MKVLNFKDIKVYRPDVFRDYRGDYWTLWKDGVDEGSKLNFNHDKVSTSKKNVIRGIHGDFKTYKLMTCLYGEVYYVVVDNRSDSKTYKQWDWIILDDKNRDRVLLPPGFGQSYLILSNEAVMHYKWSYDGSYPDVDEQFTLKWNDNRIGIHWPIDNPILSERDK